MTFGKLPAGVTGERVISKLNLADGEQVLYDSYGANQIASNFASNKQTPHITIPRHYVGLGL